MLLESESISCFNSKSITLIFLSLKLPLSLFAYLYTLVSGSGLKAQGLHLSKCILLIFAALLATFLLLVLFFFSFCYKFSILCLSMPIDLEKLPYPCRGERGFDFAIRTPCTPSRWDEFDAEMTMAWEVYYPKSHMNNHFWFRMYPSIECAKPYKLDITIIQ